MDQPLSLSCSLKRLGSFLAVIAFFTLLGIALIPLKAQSKQYYRIDFNNYKSDSKAVIELGGDLLGGNESEGWAAFKISDPQLAKALNKQTGWKVKPMRYDSLDDGTLLSSN